VIAALYLCYTDADLPDGITGDHLHESLAVPWAALVRGWWKTATPAERNVADLGWAALVSFTVALQESGISGNRIFSVRVDHAGAARAQVMAYTRTLSVNGPWFNAEVDLP